MRESLGFCSVFAHICNVRSCNAEGWERQNRLSEWGECCVLHDEALSLMAFPASHPG